jgi:hypothetical protein
VSRLPTVGGDVDQWAAILNDYLAVAHNADGTPKPQPGQELAYAQLTAPINPITALTEAAAQTVVTAPAITLDGATAILVECYCPFLRSPSAGNYGQLFLFDGAVSLGQIAQSYATGGVVDTAIRTARRLTPSAGAHTYSIRAAGNVAGAILLCGPGGVGATVPAFIRVTRV